MSTFSDLDRSVSPLCLQRKRFARPTHVCHGEVSFLYVLNRQIEQLRRCEIIKESEVKALCVKAR